jgi:hypothetical protein
MISVEKPIVGSSLFAAILVQAFGRWIEKRRVARRGSGCGYPNPLDRLGNLVGLETGPRKR